MATQTVCTCYVQHLTEEERFTLRYGAHEIECPVYRESLDPVDKLKDEETRIDFLLGRRPEAVKELVEYIVDAMDMSALENYVKEELTEYYNSPDGVEDFTRNYAEMKDVMGGA